MQEENGDICYTLSPINYKYQISNQSRVNILQPI